MTFKHLIWILILLLIPITTFAALDDGLLAVYVLNSSWGGQDATGQYGNLTIGAGCSYQNIKFGYGVNCSGTTGIMTIPSNLLNAINNTANATIVAWARQAKAASSGFWTYTAPGFSESYKYLSSNDAYPAFFLSGRTGPYTLTSDTKINHMWAVTTQNGGRYVWYYNTTPWHNISQSSNTYFQTTSTFGYVDVNNNVEFSQILFYNRTLTSTEISELYNNGTGTQYPFTPASSPDINATTSINSTVFGLQYQTAYLNLTYNPSITSRNASLLYNGTFYSPTVTTYNNSDIFEVTLVTPDASNGSLVNVSWYYNYSYANSTFAENYTANTTQTILSLLAGNCTSNVTTNRVLNYTIRNVETNAIITAASLFNFTLEYGNLSRGFFFNFSNSSNPAICVYPSFIDMDYSVHASLSATGYAPNSYISQGTVSNTTNNINIYLTNASSGAAITYTTVDSSELPLEGLTVNTFEYDVGTGTLTQVNSLITDVNGEGVAFIILNQYFVWRIYDSDHNLVLTEGPTYMGLTETAKTFIIGGNITTGLTDWITVYGLSCTVTNGTSPLGVTTVWNASNANLSNYCLNLFNVSGGNMVNFNQSCSTNLSGSLFLPVYNDTSWLAFPTMTVNGSDTTYILWCGGESPLSFNTYNQTTPLFGTEGVFWALILLVLLMTIGFAGQGAEYISMLLIIGWTAAVSMFELIPWGYATFMGIAAFLIVWLMGMRRER